jgi:hypothetical protein
MQDQESGGDFRSYPISPRERAMNKKARLKAGQFKSKSS